MKLKRKNIRLKNYDYSKEGYYYITICIKNRKEILSKIIDCNKNKSIDVGADASVRPKIKLTEIGKIIEEHLQNIDKIYEKNVILDEYIIMPDHIHFIIQIRRTEASAPTKDNSRI